MVKSAKIAVIGAGLMGHGIALTFARHGYLVTITDPSYEMRDTLNKRVEDSLKSLGEEPGNIPNIISRIQFKPSIEETVNDTDFVFEAAPEKLELKQNLFAQIEQFASPSTIIASNTSVMPITKIVANMQDPSRALGTHWWNPPHLIPLVEIVKTRWSEPLVADQMLELLQDAGKVPVMVEKDVPGFIGNRLQHAMWREAISLVENGICSAKAIDDVVKASFGRRLAVLGPMENADLVGLELTQDIHHQILYDLETSDKPSPLLQEKLDQGHKGMQSGKGLRDWASGDVEKTKAKIASHLTQIEAILPN